ncbi:putative holin [Paraburkholderia sediminicola]|uniref:putative holin n=1 Tax=Paraburkholderia sediminicola TaxID=458836 RepID=UPI0038BB6687
MAEPSTTTLAAVSAGIGLASLFPGIDGNALIGAFTGAALVVVSSKDLSIATRLAYLLISLIAGYIAAPEVVRVSPINSTAVAAFFAAALAITVTLQLIERVKSFDLLSIFKGGRG